MDIAIDTNRNKEGRSVSYGQHISRRQFLKAAGTVVAAAGLAAGAGGCSPAKVLSSTVEVKDSIGRIVQIPSAHKIDHVYFTSALAQIFCFTVAPDLIAGTSMHFDGKQLALLPEGTGDLPFLGTLSEGGTIDVEVLDYMGTQVIFSISGVDLTDVNIDDAMRLQERSGIPVVLIDGSFDQIGESYRFLGECLGREERANLLADYCEEILERVTSALQHVPQDERVTYYFAEGEQGLQTEPNASQHSLAFTTAGGINVAADEEYVVGSGAIVDVGIDQIRAWNPQFIIAWDKEYRDGAAKLIRESEAWRDIDAVRNGRVFEMPSLPFPFCDRPPGMNRFLGVQWLANLFYPRYYDVDMVDVVREFYARCYWRDVTADQAREILGVSYDYARSAK